MTQSDYRTAVSRRPGPGRDAVRASEADKPGEGAPSVVAPSRSIGPSAAGRDHA
ncbi:hypothetical protein MBT84_20550 [Streptomyces sp. MBT84]|nr:hypothetical protein [Streptomyces sp. MBT84]REE62314.1 hypothetical protein BX257_4932 [Streptomyces sp. 3212.3]